VSIVITRFPRHNRIFLSLGGTVMAKAKAQRSNDRVDRIRRALEENDEAELYSKDMVSTDALFQGVRRRAKNAADADRSTFDIRKSFRNLKITVLEAVEDGDRVVVRWRARGKWTNALPFAPTVKPNGKTIDITGFNVYRFVGDKIVEKTGEFDVASAQSQLGLNPAACVEMLQAISRPPEQFGA
jgi:predicted ester cyclase